MNRRAFFQLLAGAFVAPILPTRSVGAQVFETLVKAKRVIHGGHRLLSWNLKNVATISLARDQARLVEQSRWMQAEIARLFNVPEDLLSSNNL